MTKCEKCGSKVFVVDETASYIEVDGEIVKKWAVGICITGIVSDAHILKSTKNTSIWMSCNQHAISL